MTASHASQDGESDMRITQLLKANRFKNACLELITAYQRYLKWMLRVKCEICMVGITRWLADCPALIFHNKH